MILQLAVGPMCLMVFNAATMYGLIYAMHLVAAIAIIDALYIGLACVGVASIIDKARIKVAIRISGCVVMVLFGLNMLGGLVNLAFIPSVVLFANVSSNNIFVQGLIITAANPLTIIFWGGLFSTQMAIIGNNYQQLLRFAAGSVMATVIFLTAIASLGSWLSDFLPLIVISFLNGAVGIGLIGLGLRLLLTKADT